jgi:hypothetical protein
MARVEPVKKFHPEAQAAGTWNPPTILEPNVHKFQRESFPKLSRDWFRLVASQIDDCPDRRAK